MKPLPKSVQSLAKFIGYVLGRHPDEFGLVPDEQGFCKIKEVLKALHEEPGWTYVRVDHLTELQFSPSTDVLEVQDEKVRARDRTHLPTRETPDRLPAVLYTVVRRRAYPFVRDQGLRALAPMAIVLSSHIEMAIRLGKRIDPQAVVLTISVAAARSGGVQFKQYGETLFLANFIPANALQGPPLPKISSKPKAAPESERPKTPGSYFPDPSNIEDPSITARTTARKEKDWKQGRRAARRHKERQRRGT